MSIVNRPAFWLENPLEVPFHVNDPFNAPRDYANGLHEGIDLAVFTPTGAISAVRVAQRGFVDRIGFSATGYGHYVRVVHGWHDDTVYVTWYGHLAQVLVAVDDYLNTGDVLGIAGSTGNSTGPHLHLTLQHLGHGLKDYVVDDVIDPRPFFRLGGARPDFEELSFLADETVPDGTILLPAQPFEKRWQVRNTGSVAWGPDHRLVFAGDVQMGGPAAIPLPALRPGEAGVVALPLVAPGQAGRHRSTWQLRGPGGESAPFTLFTEIQVVGDRPQDDARFLADETIPDGTPLAPGVAFVKQWRVHNTGTTTWQGAYQLAFFGDDQLGAPSTVPLPGRTRPGEEAVLAVPLVAPSAPGRYRSTWALRNDRGQYFGDTFYADIEVTPTVLDPLERRDDARYVADVTIQDGTLMQPGEPFRKIWRLKNAGTHAWSAGYALVHVADDPLDGPAAVPLPAIEPGGFVDLAVALRAPAQAGDHRSTWQARSPTGDVFGETVFALIRVPAILADDPLDDARFEADVTVPDGTVVPAGHTFQKTWRLRNTGTTAWGPGYQLRFAADERMGAPDAVPLPPIQPGQSADVSVSLTAPLRAGMARSTWQPVNATGTPFGDGFYAEIAVPEPVVLPGTSNARLESHETIANGSTLRPGETFHKVWRIRNTGDTTWGPGYTFFNVGGERMNGPDSVAVPETKPQKIATLSVTLTASAVAGAHRGIWRLRDPAGNTFGSLFHVAIDVAGEAVDLLPFLRGDGRQYEMKHVFVIEGQRHEGQERVQTQTDAQGRFYHVKNGQWEELWADDDFIYRGTDTSPGEGRFYHQSENGRHGSPWIPRRLTPDTFFRRAPIVTFQRKDNCATIARFTHITWIRLEAVLDQLTLDHPDPQSNQPGLTVPHVAVLAAHNDAGGRPADDWFERYYYAQRYGLIRWEGRGHINGQSWLVEEHAPGARPPMARETLACQPG